MHHTHTHTHTQACLHSSAWKYPEVGVEGEWEDQHTRLCVLVQGSLATQPLAGMREQDSRVTQLSPKPGLGLLICELGDANTPHFEIKQMN